MHYKRMDGKSRRILTPKTWGILEIQKYMVDMVNQKHGGFVSAKKFVRVAFYLLLIKDTSPHQATMSTNTI